MQLDTYPVELELDVGLATELLQQAGHVGQALGELWADRSADHHLQAFDRVYAVRPQRFAEQPQVGGAVVGLFQHRLFGFGAAQAGLGERGQDRRVANAKPARAERNAHQVFSRDRVDAGQQARQCVELAVAAASA